jgi:hypothetical protein
VRPEVRNDPVIFPSAEELRQAHFFLPLRTKEEWVYKKAWERFLAAPPTHPGDQ